MFFCSIGICYDANNKCVQISLVKQTWETNILQYNITKVSIWESKTVADIISEIYDALRTQVGIYTSNAISLVIIYVASMALTLISWLLHSLELRFKYKWNDVLMYAKFSLIVGGILR